MLFRVGYELIGQSVYAYANSETQYRLDTQKISNFEMYLV